MSASNVPAGKKDLMPVKDVRLRPSQKAWMSKKEEAQRTFAPEVQEGMLEIDARGMEPPQPLVVILEAVSRLSEGGELRARTDNRPMHLYGRLEERGFVGITEEQPDGSFVTQIHRP